MQGRKKRTKIKQIFASCKSEIEKRKHLMNFSFEKYYVCQNYYNTDEEHKKNVFHFMLTHVWYIQITRAHV